MRRISSEPILMPIYEDDGADHVRSLTHAASSNVLSSLLAQIEYFQLGEDYIERYTSLVQAVTAAEVAAAARKYLRPEALIVVAVGPEPILATQDFSEPAP